MLVYQHDIQIDSEVYVKRITFGWLDHDDKSKFPKEICKFILRKRLDATKSRVNIETNCHMPHSEIPNSLDFISKSEYYAIMRMK